ncbi:MAG: GreA/GreB family elongation factor [Victivallales bacterium]|nr:GreA/GreB family elongation factor [Victivallales bacterium]
MSDPLTTSIPRWDGSRSIVELEGRLNKMLANFGKVVLSDPPADLEPVKALLSREASRETQAPSWCNAVAIIQKDAQADPALDLRDYLKENASAIVAWSNPELFVTIADKMPGKLVPAWFATTLSVMGPDYLIGATLRMPHRLWSVTEKLLSADKALSEHFVQQIKQAFREDKITADHYFWLWKWKAPKSDTDRATYLAKPYTLFRILGREVKGNYLKSQRELRRLLLSDESFQKALTHNGDETISRDLINCAKRIVLLDASERQALLVKICGLFPHLKPYVAGDAPVQRRLNLTPHTSARSYQELQKRLQNLIDVEIPANAEAIKTAKGHGDLSENSEFKAAKERQRELGRLRLQLEQQVADIQPTDFTDVKVGDTVIPGCVVTVKYADDDHTEAFTILGLLDNDPDHNSISYDTPLAKCLLAKKLGEEVMLPNRKVIEIEKLEPLSAELLAKLKG